MIGRVIDCAAAGRRGVWQMYEMVEHQFTIVPSSYSGGLYRWKVSCTTCLKVLHWCHDSPSQVIRFHLADSGTPEPPEPPVPTLKHAEQGTFRRHAYELWKLVDDIDNVGSAHLDSPVSFAASVASLVARRFKILQEDEVRDMYMDFFNWGKNRCPYCWAHPGEDHGQGCNRG